MSNFTKNILVNEWTATVQDIIVEAIEYDEFNDVDELTEKVRELLHETLDGCQEVIYTYQAKDVCEALDYDIFEEDPNYGEKANNWSQAAYMAIDGMINEEINMDEMCDTAFLEMISEEQ